MACASCATAANSLPPGSAAKSKRSRPSSGCALYRALLAERASYRGGSLWRRKDDCPPRRARMHDPAPASEDRRNGAEPWPVARRAGRRVRRSQYRWRAGSAYRGLGTFEFSGHRKQRLCLHRGQSASAVEHTVSEEVFGVDLVKTQIRVADGAQLQNIGLVPRRWCVARRCSFASTWRS